MDSSLDPMDSSIDPVLSSLAPGLPEAPAVPEEPRGLTNPPLPTRSHLKPTAAKKSKSKITKVVNQEAKEKLADDVDKFLLDQEKKIVALATLHGVKREAVDKLINHKVNYTHSRAPNLANALVHHKTVEVNAGRAERDKYSLTEIRDMVRDDPKLQSLSTAEQDQMKEQLAEARVQKKTGTRVSVRSASQDVRHTFNHVNTAMHELSERTGTYCLMFMTRGHIEDSAQPGWYGSRDSFDFLADILHLNPWDIVIQFEQWACARSKAGKNLDTLPHVRADCTKLLLTGLRWAAQSRNVHMAYDDYDTNVVERYGCKLVGWTLKEFKSPSDIGAVVALRELRDALKSGTCKWVRLTKHEKAAHNLMLKERKTAGQVPEKKKRKERSDKGKTRPHTRKGASGSRDEETGEPPAKKSRGKGKGKGADTPSAVAAKSAAAASNKLPKSKAYVDSNSDTDETSGGESD
ncbi:hypothetical protein FA95DRAFT_1613183 [Auriscalpium vulgare]|uniref:Uncharacterized protein n=1 Tax=Auriscalpium vulgare TaxID=40419 RepID=A0ACB8R3L9_9AGAM|nr:hypothetical protein FA95DRAFT_1613183 [Auriscalpium vulgare]